MLIVRNIFYGTKKDIQMSIVLLQLTQIVEVVEVEINLVSEIFYSY